MAILIILKREKQTTLSKECNQSCFYHAFTTEFIGLEYRVGHSKTQENSRITVLLNKIILGRFTELKRGNF